MADNAVTITLKPNEILLQVIQSIKGRVDSLERPIDIETTCTKALQHVVDSLENKYNPDIWMTPTRTRAERDAVRNLAKTTNEDLGPLKVRNCIPAAQLPPPQAISQKGKMVLKENFRNELSLRKPFHHTVATIEDAKLPNLSARIALTAIDSDNNTDDPRITIQTDHCLFDTGAQYCSVSDDLVDPAFLNLKVHDNYRFHNNLGIQADSVFSLSNSTFKITGIFFILPLSSIPNRRSGVILGQHTFIDKLMVELIPRSILIKRGEHVGPRIWGDMNIKAMVNIFDELEEFTE